MTRRPNPRSPHRRRSRRAGAALLLVLIAAAIAFTIASALLTSQATTITIAQNATDLAQARFVAESGLRITAAYVQRTATWRSDRTPGAWASNVTCAPGTFSVAGYDGADANGDGVIAQPSEGDGNLADDSNDLLTLVVTGTVNGATHIARAVVSPGASGPTPKHHWKLDETSGTTAVDAVGSRNGTLVNFTTSNSKWIAGQVDGGLDFDGSNDYVNMGTGCLVTSAWTVALWVRPGGAADYSRLFIQGDGACGSRQLMMYWHSSQVEMRTTSSGAAGNPNTATSDLPDGQWRHVTWTYDGSSHKVYVNGALSSAAPDGTNVGMDGDNYLGRRDAGNYFDGALDDVRVFDRALTAAEVSQVYSGAAYAADSGGGGTPAAAVTAITSATTNYSHAAGTGANRLLVVVVGMEDTYNRTVSAITYGGRPMTQITTAAAGGNSGNPYDRVSLYYLNEAGIAAASGSTISVTWSGSVDDSHVAAAMFANVDQANPIRASVSLDVDASTPNPIVAPTLTVAASDLAVAAAICGNTGNYTWNNSFSEGTDHAGSTSQMSTGGRNITSGTSVTPSATHAGPNRQAIIAATLAAAPAEPVASSTFAVRWVK